MSAKKQPQNPQDNIHKLMSEGEDLTEGKTFYVNTVHVNVGVAEVVMDLYLLSPDRTKVGQKKAQAQLLGRVVMSPSVAKDLNEVLNTTLQAWEDIFGITLPLRPQELDDEKSTRESDSQ